MPHDQAEIAINAAPAPAWSPGARLGSGSGGVNSVQEFIDAANNLPTWKSLSVQRDGATVSLSR